MVTGEKLSVLFSFEKMESGQIMVFRLKAFVQNPDCGAEIPAVLIGDPFPDLKATIQQNHGSELTAL
jgi:hypothetical protein